MTRCAPLLLVVLCLAPAWAGDESPADPAARAAAAVLAALQAKDEAALKALAAKDDPQPWFVADVLCGRGEIEAARAFARAAARPALAALPAYLAKAPSRGGEAAARIAIEAGERALRAARADLALKATEGLAVEGDTVLVARGLIVRAEALGESGLGAQAGPLWRRLAELGKRLGWTWAEAVGSYSLAVAHLRAGDAGRAAPLLEGAATAASKGHHHRLGMTASDLRGRVHFMSGAAAAALPWYEGALAHAEKLGDEPSIATGALRLASVLSELGSDEEAIPLHERALALYDKAGDRATAASALMNLGTSQARLGAQAQAILSFERARDLKTSLGDTLGAARAMANLGGCLSDLGDLQGAEDVLERSIAVLRETGNPRLALGALTNLGILHLRRGRYAQALTSLEHSLALLGRGLDDQRSRGGLWAHIGNVHMALGNLPRALEFYRRAAQLQRSIGDTTGALITLSNQAGVEGNLGDKAAAVLSFQRIVGAWKSLGQPQEMARALVNLGKAHGEAGELDKSAGAYEEAIAAGRESGANDAVAIGEYNLGDLRSLQRNGAEARKHYARALEVAEPLGMQRAIVHVLEGLAGVALAEGQAAEAIGYARDGVLAVERVTRGLSGSEGAGGREYFVALFDRGVLASGLANSAESLAWFLERGRAHGLRESLGSRAALEEAVVPAGLRAALREARADEVQALAAHRRAARRGARALARKTRQAWQAARQRVEDVTARIEREAKAAASLSLGAVDDLPTIRGRLAAGEALIFYTLTTYDALALVVRRDGVRGVNLGPSEAVVTACEELALEDVGADAGEGLARLRAAVIAPLQLPDSVTRVLVSPDGLLGYVPFAMLLPAVEIVYVPSGTAHGLLVAEAATEGTGILALGDPDYGTIRPAVAALRRGGAMTLLPLPATRKEVEAIGTLRLLGKDASESGLEAALGASARWRAVHFACHGLVDPARPMLSSLALTADTENDGFLTALEIFRQRIPADLVVLSACETGKGKIYRTEGIVGLTRAFMFAGAPRVLCSLWKVDDAATSALMTRFYELWNPKEGKGLGAAAALKQAQAFVRGHDKWKHPYYWAAWVLWGLP